MTKTETATRQMEAWASDNSHGYDQRYRWGEKGDFDCSAAVIQAWENAGVPVKTNGATYTGNMLYVFKKCGFKDVKSSVNLSTGAGLKRGDVLLHNQKHTAMYCGNGMEVEASINEHGGATGGTPGDQTGKEFLKRSYRNFPWQHVLRYAAEENEPEAIPESEKATNKITNEASYNSISGKIDTVSEVQIWLNRNFSAGLTTDGFYGDITKKALTKALQKTLGVTADGIYGAKTNAAVKLVRYGSKGQLVSVLQAFLVCHGYKEAYVDGNFGSGTKNALTDYQRKYKLEVDGIAGQETFKSLCS